MKKFKDFVNHSAIFLAGDGMSSVAKKVGLLLGCIALSVSAAACKKVTDEKVENLQGQVIEIDPPKWFRVKMSFRDNDMVITENFSVSKRCYNWKSAKLGDTNPIKKVVRKYEDGSSSTRYYAENSLRKRYCN